MPGLYTYTPRPTGDVITADEYNGDHQLHVTNNTATQAGGYSENESQMQTTVDPGVPGTPSLAVSIADEFTRIRWVLRNIKAAIHPSMAHWYTLMPAYAGSATFADFIRVMKGTTLFETTELLRTEVVPGYMITVGGYASHDWENGVTTAWRTYWRVPETWIAGSNPTFTWHRTPDVSSGTAVMNYEFYRHRTGAAILGIEGGAANLVSASLNTVTTQVVVSNTNLAIGDIVESFFIRLGADGADTLAGKVKPGGQTVQFLAVAGRP